MPHGMWSTKEDVLKDLEVASGRRVADVNDDFFVIGHQPPPPRVIDDEDVEFELRFGGAKTMEKQNVDHEAEPDLQGITKLLRMVQDYEKSSDEENINTTAIVTPKKENGGIVISKLNPNVREFVPKSSAISSQNLKTYDNNVSVNLTGVKTTYTERNKSVTSTASSTKTNSSGSNSSLLENINSTSKTEQNPKTDCVMANSLGLPKEIPKQSDFHEMAKMLKSEISVKSDSFEDKRKTNLAIVNLLKLYAKPESKAVPSKTLKLYTPDFFATSKAVDFKSNDLKKSDASLEQSIASLPTVDEDIHDVPHENLQNSSNIKLDTSLQKNNSVTHNNKNHDISSNEKNDHVEKAEYRSINDECHFNKEDNENLAAETSLTPNMAYTSIDDYTENNLTPSVVIEKPADPELEESIKKVSNWLDNKPYVNKEKTTRPVVYLGPVAYKRKDPVTCKSPSEIADKKISKPSDISAYKPSKYADELHEQFKQNTQKNAPVLNIWDKLEEDLKRKDEEIKIGKKKASSRR